ncbi:HAMP domain-containing sensor histidine kinase [Pseudomonas sp. B14-6]|uniref:sensor histidine kinase n=1 Tax=Pseudomonas sp. B14-6 TaxID=2738843 RepID=UPI00211476AF|nr:HAMP domain-containing sensor histidine kinase [Pseudomonas sp. B14-6]
MADATRELIALGQKLTKARADLAALQQDLIDAINRLNNSEQVKQLIEANQQLVLAILAKSDDVTTSGTEGAPQQGELVEANEHLVIAALSAQHLQALAEHALGQQKRILAMVAHELRNPLTPISMIAERMVRMPSAELPKMQALIQSQVQHMSQMVDDLLDVSRASTGKLRINCHEVDILQVIREAAGSCRPSMNAHQLNFISNIPEGTLILNGDPVRLGQILNNLLTNAVKYTQAHGVINLSVTIESDVVRISISDNGIGVPAKVLPFIFDPYVQDLQAVGFNGSGLGIGLMVVRELVEAHGGHVTGTSEGNGKGSEFVVTLPLLSH